MGGLLGTMMVFYFTGLAVAAVASAAQEVGSVGRYQQSMLD